MGSLMSGWSSSVLSDKEVRVMRNRSLTNEEVEAFWRQHGGRPAAENGEAAAAGSPLAGSPRASHEILLPLPSPRAQQEIPLAARRMKAMRSMPPLRGPRSDALMSLPCGGQHLYPRSEPSSPATTTRREIEGCFVFTDQNNDAADDTTSSTSRGWWTRSSWAFLNEPPKEQEVLLGRAHRSFACDQFHAARIVTGNA